MAARFPVVFTAHGNPMNALPGTPFAGFLRAWSASRPTPRSILCVSAHWERRGLAVTSTESPRTVHDFWGFPEELYRLDYRAPGSPALAARVRNLLSAAGLGADADPERGLDHGAWAPLRHLYPGAEVPVVQVSLPVGEPLSLLLEVGRALAPLREEEVLILGSGNLVHNLRTADLERREAPVPAWARSFDQWVRDRLETWDLAPLCDPWEASPDGSRAHPTLEHYAPLLVVCGASGACPSLRFPNETFEHGTVSMRCVQME
ncbi:MAG: dioxygenase [Deltaproteobacteria bacterium]|nr:dioxygenase [Deltaproteobacteria bacterium]